MCMAAGLPPNQEERRNEQRVDRWKKDVKKTTKTFHNMEF